MLAMPFENPETASVIAPERLVTWKKITLASGALHATYNYEISDLGQVRIFYPDQMHVLLKPEVNRGGYHRVRLWRDDGRRVWYRVHLLVLETFVGPRPTTRHHGAHLDNNKSHNGLSNLSWKTPVENAADKKLHGTATGGVRGGVPKLPVRAILNRRAKGQSMSKIAKDLKVHRHSVSRIINGQRQAAQTKRYVELLSKKAGT
jgi:hypothetical protein